MERRDDGNSQPNERKTDSHGIPLHEVEDEDDGGNKEHHGYIPSPKHRKAFDEIGKKSDQGPKDAEVQNGTINVGSAKRFIRDPANRSST